MEYLNKITSVVGVMYAGKSEYIINKYIELKDKYTIEAFKPIGNNRGGNTIVSRAKDIKIPCKRTGDITEALESKAEIIFIDECQNFNYEQLKHTLTELKAQNKTVFIAGLEKNGVNEHWRNYKLLEKLSDKIVNLKLKCELCNLNAEFSCLVKFGENKSYSTTKNAIYKNLCGACSVGRNILLK